MKSQNRPSISDEMVIPKPAPGENVYPIYSQGAICGYIYSGGNQKTHKIFLNGDSQSTSTEEKLPKKKTNDLKEKSSSVKKSKNSTTTTTKAKTKQTVNPKPQKQKAVSSPKKISLLPKKFGIESKIIIQTSSDKVNAPCSPTKQTKGADNADLGKKKSCSTATHEKDNISLRVSEVPSNLVTTSTANNNVQQLNNPTDLSSHVVKQNPMLQPPLITSTSSNLPNLPNKMVVSSQVNSGANDTVLFSSPLMTNHNPPVVLASNNSALQPTKWLTAPVQSTWPNTVTYFIMPAGTVNQTPVLLANSANTLSTLLPTNMSLTTPTVTPTATPTVTVTPTATPSATVSTVNSSVVNLPSSPAMINSTATLPITMMSRQMSSCNQILSNLPLKAIVPKSTFVQLPFQRSSSSSLLNQKIDVLSQNQPNVSQFKTIKIINQSPHLENENVASENLSSVNVSSGNNIANQQTSKVLAVNPPLASKVLHPFVLNDEKLRQKSTSSVSDTKSSSSSNEADINESESTKTVQEKSIESELSTKSNQTNRSEPSGDEDVSKEICNEFSLENNQFILVPWKRPRGRPKKPLIAPKYEKRKEIPILPATVNVDSANSMKQQSFNLLPSGNYVISFTKEENDETLSKNQSEKVLSNLSQYESDKQLTCDKEENGDETETMMDKSSFCEEKETYDLTNEDEIIIKTEPLDEFSDLTQKELENWSDNRPSSASPFNVGVKSQIECKKEKNSEDELTSFQKEKELLISRSFSFGINTKNGTLSTSDAKSTTTSSSSNEADVNESESTKSVQEKSIDSELSKKSNQTNKSEASGNKDVSKEICNKSSLENSQIIIVPMNQAKGQPLKSIIVPNYLKRKEILIHPATGNNTEIERSTKSQSFSLLPSGKFVIPCLKRNDATLSKNQSEKVLSNLSQYESDKQLTCDKKENRNETETMMDKSSFCEEKETYDLTNEDEIIIKTEPLDEFSYKEKKNSENELIPFQEEKEENELIISSSFSLSNHTESQKKLFPFNSVNPAFDNFFFLPSKSDSDVQEEKSTNLSEEIKLKNCSVQLEPLILPSNLLSSCLSSEKEEEKGTKNVNSSSNSSLNKDELNVKTLDSSASVSATAPKGTKRSFDDSAKSISDQKCLKKLKENNDDDNDLTEIDDISREGEMKKMASKSTSESVSTNSLLIQDFINNSLKKSLQNSSALASNDDSMIIDLTKNEEKHETLIEGAIAFHQNQLYLLKLQMDHHEKALERLKKAQNYLNAKQ